MSNKIAHLYIIACLCIIFFTIYATQKMKVDNSYRKVELENQETMIKLLIETKNDIFWWNKQAI